MAVSSTLEDIYSFLVVRFCLFVIYRCQSEIEDDIHEGTMSGTEIHNRINRVQNLITETYRYYLQWVERRGHGHQDICQES